MDEPGAGPAPDAGEAHGTAAARRSAPLHAPAGGRARRDAARAHPAAVAGAGLPRRRRRRPRLHRRRRRGAERAVDAHRLRLRRPGHRGLDRAGDGAVAVPARRLADRHAGRRPDAGRRGGAPAGVGGGRHRGGAAVAAPPAARAGLRLAPPPRGERGPAARRDRPGGPPGARGGVRRPGRLHLAQPRDGRARAGRHGRGLRGDRDRGHRPAPRAGGEDRGRRRPVHRRRAPSTPSRSGCSCPRPGTPRNARRCGSGPPTARC